MRARCRFLGLVVTGAVAGVVGVSAHAFACTERATVRAAPTAGAVGSETQLALTEFYPSSEAYGPVEIRWNTTEGPPLATVPMGQTTTADGQVIGSRTTLRINIPTASPGFYAIHATQRRLSDQSVVGTHATPFRVTTNAAPPNQPPGDPVPGGEPPGGQVPGGQIPGQPSVGQQPVGPAPDRPTGRVDAPVSPGGDRPAGPRAPAGTAATQSPGGGPAPAASGADQPVAATPPAEATTEAPNDAVEEGWAEPAPTRDDLWSGVSSPSPSLLASPFETGSPRSTTSAVGGALLAGGLAAMAATAAVFVRRRLATVRTRR